MNHIRGSNLAKIYDINADLDKYRGKTKVIVNGNWVAYAIEPLKFV